MKKLLLLPVFFLLLLNSAKSQCLPDNCSLVITNKIDCYVVNEITYTCPPSAIPYSFTTTLNPGNSATPWVTTGNAVWPPSPPATCDCSTASISSVKVVSIGAYNFIPPVALGSSTTNLYLTTCCNLDYGTYSGCNIDLWMSCP